MTTRLHFPALLAVTVLALGCEKKADTLTITLPAATPIPMVTMTTPDTATDTLETKTLGAAIDQYIATPGTGQAAIVDKAFAELDGEIAELKERVAKTTGSDQAEAQGKLLNLSSYRAKETLRYGAARMTDPVAPVGAMTPVDTRSGAEKMEDGAKKVGEEIKDTAEKVGDTVQKGAENVGDKIKDATDGKP